MTMSPTSRNALKIGGALILIALLLVCGPLSDRFGSGGKGVKEAPPVAAGPPPAVDSTDAITAAATGALVGASVAGPEAAAGGIEEPIVSQTPIVPIAAVAAASVAGATSAAVAGGNGHAHATPPPVSAAGPVAAVVEPDVARVFDDALASANPLGIGGALVDRFAPPVSAGPALAQNPAGQPFGLTGGDVLLPCDTPGSGCRNVSPAAIGGGGVNLFGSGNPRGNPIE